MPDRLSLAKDKIRVLLLEGINDSAVGCSPAPGYTNVTRLPKALAGEALREALEGVHLLGIRSRTQLTATMLAARRPADRGGLLQRRHQPGRSRRGAAARRAGVQCAVLQHAQRRRAGDRRDRHAAAPASSRARSRRTRAAGTSRPRAATRCAARRSASSATAISARQLSMLAEAMGMRVIFYDQHRQAARTATPSRPAASRSCWRRATWSACTSPRRRRRTA